MHSHWLTSVANACAARTICMAAMSLGLPLFASDAAHSQSAEQVAQEFGFVGHWAMQLCDRPASSENWRRRIVVSGGEVSWTEDCGNNCGFSVPIKYVVQSIERVGAERISMRVRRIDQAGTYDFIMRMADGRLRTMSNQAVDGKILVRDGIIVSNGAPTPQFTKCQ